MDKKTLVGIIIVLALGIGGAYYLKTNKVENSPTPHPQQQQSWDQWQNNSPQNNPPATSPEVKPDQPSPLPSPKSYQEALSISNQRNAQIFLYFETDNCTYCKQMKSQTFSDPKVKEKLSRYVVYYCNAQKERSLALKYGVLGVPAYFVIDKNETKLKSDKGFKPSDEFIVWLDGKKFDEFLQSNDKRKRRSYQEELTVIED